MVHVHSLPREARLQPEFARLYPAVPADAWHPASAVADLVWEQLLQRGQAQHTRRERVLNPAHFEFRGGEAPTGPAGARRRRSDG